jgi:hypothetical protein
MGRFEGAARLLFRRIKVLRFRLPAQLGGRVSPSGYVQADAVAGPRTAHAVGRLRQFQDSGTWAGSGPSGVCSGVWNCAPLRQTF